MAYAAWSVVFGEQPSAAKWNILGTNDSSFNDGTGISNLEVGSGHTSVKNDYKFSAYRVAALANVSASPIIFDTKAFDTGSNYSVSTGLFTAPVSGFYQFNAFIAMANPGVTGYSAFFNVGGTTHYMQETVTTSNVGNVFGYSGSRMFQLSASATVSVGGGGSSGAMSVGLGTNTFEGFLVSQT